MSVVVLWLLFTILPSSGQEHFLKLKQVYSRTVLEKTLQNENEVDQLRDQNGKTILHYAASKDKEGNILSFLATTYPLLLEQPDYDGHTPLHFAAFHGNYRGTEVLLSLGANPNASNKYGKTPGHKAVQLGNFDTDCLQHIKVILSALHNHHADFNMQDIYGNTLLHDVALRANSILFDTLRQIPAIDSTIKNKKNYTAEQLLVTAQNALLTEQYLRRYSRQTH